MQEQTTALPVSNRDINGFMMVWISIRILLNVFENTYKLYQTNSN
ncbi:MAG: hypothetical protein OIN90_07135 [Candidatus Methanoperedens sp.]|nr:hypothetical protein [Candidatus Methanoperedens sp. BLZ2]MCX9077767.1 hypothetical protein [Candidatus Methanoperedens sp.]MCX9087318.1 hypothetical protein [Candidatus Methanoperedens sp.]